MAEITTSVPAVQDWLHAAARDTLAPHDIPVLLGQPHPDRITGHALAWLPLSDPTSSHSQTYRVTSLTAKAEAFEQPIVVFTQSQTVDPATARARLDTAVHALLALISDNPTLDGLAELAEVTQVIREEAQPAPGHQHLAATLTVRVRAWLVA